MITQEKWIIKTQGNNILIHTESGFPVATVGCCNIDYKQRAEQEKRSRLIASAPDLLEALKTIRKIRDDYNNHGIAFDRAELNKVLEQAIDKVERETENGD